MASYYCSPVFSHTLKKSGIVHQFSAPYVPQQNGFAERLNRTLIEATRTSMHSGKLPLFLWGETLSSIAQVYNFTPHTGIEYSCPHEALFGESPSVNRLRPIGAPCTYLIRNSDSKFDPKGNPAILIGAYRLWDTEDCKVVISYDVTFSPNNTSKDEIIERRQTEQLHPSDPVSFSIPLLSGIGHFFDRFRGRW